jgi:CheY-like chemotaxis protein
MPAPGEACVGLPGFPAPAPRASARYADARTLIEILSERGGHDSAASNAMTRPFGTLIVDDHAGFRTALATILRSRFPLIRIDEAFDGTDAWRVIRGYATDLVLMDIKLPGGSGIELTKAIKQSIAGITVVILTAHDVPHYRQAAFRNGADCFIGKGSPSCTADVRAPVEGAMAARQELHALH